ncbi:MAG TPA: F0F1 ATP synthase subunit A, partial [Chitinophagaceae bacterium]|nr:F0F1 ATP synthase subunit A [Chitinophagaceae bacterium]
MTGQRFKSFAVAVFSIFCLLFSGSALAQHEGADTMQQKKEQAAINHEGEKEKFDAGKLIFGHVLNGHEFHFLNIGDKPISIPLPIILYSPQRGFTTFMSSKFEHGHKDYKQYRMLTEHSIAEMGLDTKKYVEGDIVPVTASGDLDTGVKLYDVSLTRNVVQMLLALILFVWIMIRIANRYKKGIGVTSAPKGSQSLMEPVIEFIRDEVAIPNLGRKYPKY